MRQGQRGGHRERFGQAGEEPQQTPWYHGQLGGFLRGRLASLGEIPSLLEEFGIHSAGGKLDDVPRTFSNYDQISGQLKGTDGERGLLPQHPNESPWAEVAGQFVGPLDVTDLTRGAALGALGVSGTMMRKVSPRKQALELLGVNKINAVTDVQLRDHTLEDAITIARQELHIRKGTDGLAGAPSWVKDRRHVKRMRKDFDEMVNQGVVGSDWYKRVRGWIDEVSGGDPAKADRMAQELALYSAQANPDTNLGWAIELRTALQSGRTEIAAAAGGANPMPMIKTGAQTRKAVKAFESGGRIKQGPKTGNYEQQLNPTERLPTTGTNDIWHGRAFGYTGKNGKPFSRGFTAQEHAFLDAETVLAVDRANQRSLGGRTDWSAGEIQASAWVFAKGQAEFKKSPKKFAHDPQEAFKWASLTYPDHVKKYTAKGTYEEVPGAGTGQLQSLLQGDLDQRQKFTDSVPWTNPQGQDEIYESMMGGNVRRSNRATGIFFGPDGVETNPANVANPLIAQAKDPKGRIVAPTSRDVLNAAEGVRSFVDIQNVGAWHKAFPFREGGVASKAANGIWIPMERPLSLEEMQNLADFTDPLDYFISDSGQGVVLFPNPKNKKPPDGIEIRKRLKGGMREQLEEIVPEAGKVDRARVETNAIDMFQDADEVQRPPGSGMATKEVLRHLMNPRAPMLLERLDASPGFRKIVAAKIKRNLQAVNSLPHQLWGDKLREDHMRALEIIVESGFAGLKRALDNGQVLPAVALPIFGVAFGTSDSET